MSGLDERWAVLRTERAGRAAQGVDFFEPIQALPSKAIDVYAKEFLELFTPVVEFWGLSEDDQGVLVERSLDQRQLATMLAEWKRDVVLFGIKVDPDTRQACVRDYDEMLRQAALTNPSEHAPIAEPARESHENDGCPTPEKISDRIKAARMVQESRSRPKM